MISRGKNIVLRLPTLSDVPLLSSWENDPIIKRISGSHNESVSTKDMVLFVLNHNDFKSSGQLRLIIANIHGRVIGTVDLFGHVESDNRCELGILIAKDEDRNKGYGTETIQLVTVYASTVLKIKTIVVNVSRENIRSQKLFERTGFVQDTAENDLLCYSRQL